MKVTIEVFGTESANELLCASRFLGDLASTKNEVIEQPEKVSDEKAAKLKAEEDAAVAARIAEAEEKRAALEEAEKKAKADAEKKRVLAEAKAAAKAKAEEEAAAKAKAEAEAEEEAVAKAEEERRAKVAAEKKAKAEAEAKAAADTTDFDNEPETADKPLTVEDCRKVAMIALNRQKKELVKEAFEACDARAFPSLKAENYQKFIDYLNERL